MRCEFCGEDLNPFLLKQAMNMEGMIQFEVECLNPACRRKNWVSKEGYLALRNDFLPSYTEPINNKLPSDMNVLFVSMPHMGVEWVIRSLNQVHEAMFGRKISFPDQNREISSEIFFRKDLDIPLGWSNVYEIDPQYVIDKVDPSGISHDRIILLQRNLSDLSKAWVVKWTAHGLAPSMVQKLLEKGISKYHEMYDREYRDPRFMRIHMEDLNNRTVATFKKVMDHLNFPSFRRAPLIPIPVERDWEVYSSILEEEEEICKALQMIEDMKEGN